jgi:long-chain acyl-CoA synthetase
VFDGSWYRSGELFERSQRIASGLVELGVAPGDRVVVVMANCPEVGIVYQALWRAGAVVTPAIFLLAPSELRHVVSDAEACGVIATPEMIDKVREATAGLHCVRFVVCTEPAGDGVQTLSDIEQAPARAIVARGDDELAALMYTGGTTGRAKGVMLSHGNLHFTGRAGHQAGYIPGLNRGLLTLPLSHSYGLLITIIGLHSPERPVSALLRWFDPDRFLGLIERHQLQQSAVVPSMLQILLSKPLERYDLSPLRYLACGAAPLPAEIEEQFRRRLPTVSIRQGYGLTETAALVASNPAGAELRGSVGLPVPGSELRIVDPAGAALPPGEVGEITIRSPAVMRGYWRSPETTAEAIRDGWLHTGDLGYVDQQGYLFIVDRKKDLIIRGGFNVYPRDVEDALLEHPALAMAAVVGRPDQRTGEEVVAFVSLQPGSEASPEALIGWAREHIGGHRYPRELYIVDTVPLTAVGKVDRKQLRSALPQHSG